MSYILPGDNNTTTMNNKGLALLCGNMPLASILFFLLVLLGGSSLSAAFCPSSPSPSRLIARQAVLVLSPPPLSSSSALLSAMKDDASASASASSSSSGLYQELPSKTPWTLGVLTSGFPPQQLLVPFVKFVTFFVWRLMMNELVTHDEDGRFIRESFQAGNDPSPLELDDTRRYRLYLGNPCPWCHRVKAALALLDLEGDIPVTTLIDDAEKASKGGWILPPPTEEDSSAGIAKELLIGDLAGVYNYCYLGVLEDGETYQGRCTAPLLVDTRTGTIVTNESNEIMVLLNDYARRKRQQRAPEQDAAVVDLRPVGSEERVDAAAKYWFDLLWNGAYRCGFATSQAAYDEAASDVLKGLREMDDHLATNPYLLGNSITEVDLKNFAWACRHDHAYTVIFKSPGGRLAQYPNIAKYIQRMVKDHPKLLDSVDLPDACGSYYRQLFMLNFGRIVPYVPSVREWVAGL